MQDDQIDSAVADVQVTLAFLGRGNFHPMDDVLPTGGAE